MPLPKAIIDLEEYTGSINILIYGEPNAGKTTLVGQLPNNLILATEQGTVSAARSKTRASNVKVWEIKNWSDMEEAFLFLKNENGKLKSPFKWVSIDSISAMQQVLLQDLLAAAHKDNPAKYSLDVPQIQDHQLWQNKFKRFVKAFNDLGLNTLWTATVQELLNSDGDPVLHPFLQGKKGGIARWVEAEPHIVAHYGKAGKNGEVKRRLVFDEVLPDPDNDKPGIFAKNRYNGALPKVVVMSIDDEQLTTLAEVMAKVEGVSPIQEADEDFAPEPEEIEEVAETEAEPETAKVSSITKKASRFKATDIDDDDNEEKELTNA